jgi:hypothetical protein
VHFSLQQNFREAGGNTVQQDAAIDPQGDPRKHMAASIPMLNSDGLPIADWVLHITCHGRFAMTTQVRKIAAELNLFLMDLTRANLDPIDGAIFPKIKGWDGFAEETDGVTYIMPDGYYKDATGTTTPFRTYYQAGLVNAKGVPEFDKNAHTWLEISNLDWRYFETGDYETRFQVRVVYTPEWDTQKQAWGYRKEPFERHQAVAIRFIKRMLEELHKSPPSDLSIKLRKLVQPSDKPRTTDPEGWHGLSHDELVEQERELMLAIARKDYQTAVDAISGPTVPAAADPLGNTVDIEVFPDE